MNSKSLLLCTGILLGLSACNTGSTSSNNGVSISATPPNCNNITSASSCIVTVVYSATSGSSSLGQALIMNTPSNYAAATTTCSNQLITTNSQTCTFTVSCANNTCTGAAGTAYICPANQASSCSSYASIGLQSY